MFTYLLFFAFRFILSSSCMLGEANLREIYHYLNLVTEIFQMLSSAMTKACLLTCTLDGVHQGRVELASPIELTTTRIEVPQARRSCSRSLKIFIQSFLHRAQPKNRGPERA